MAESPASEKLTGTEIIESILQGQQEGVWPLGSSVLVPCYFYVYLHPDDFQVMRAVVPRVREEARRALQKQLDRWNQEAQPPKWLDWLGVRGSERIVYEKTAPDWVVDFYPDQEDKIEKGEVVIYSELAEEARTEPGGGDRTVMITRRDGQGHTTSHRETVPSKDGEPARETGFASIRYTDETGSHEYRVEKEVTVIGRGGDKAIWIDLKLVTVPDVSREHCRIRRDPATGNFFLKDVSSLGTAIDGRRVASSLETTADGQRRDKNVEVPLPDTCRLTLGDVFHMEFRKVGA
jgi:hypothetical protein